MKDRKAQAVMGGALALAGVVYGWYCYHTPEAYVSRGYAMNEKHLFLAAVGQFREASRRRPMDPKLHTELGWSLYRSGSRPEPRWIWQDGRRRKVIMDVGYPAPQEAKRQAVSEFRTAVLLRPRNSLYHYNYGIMLSEEGQKDQALAEFRVAVSLAPATESSPDTAPWDNHQFLSNLHSSIGSILVERKDYKGAIEEYRECVNYWPQDIHAENDLAGLLNQTGQRREARAIRQDVVTKLSKLDQDDRHGSPEGQDAQTMLAKYPQQP